MGPKTHSGELPLKSGEKWLGTGAHKEEDREQQVKDESNDRHTKNKQEALDR